MANEKRQVDEGGDGSRSEYELQRIKNIQRNNARLRALGLISKVEETESNAAAKGTKLKKSPAEAPAKSAKIKKRAAPSSPVSSPERKSRRLQGLNPDGGQVIDENDRTSMVTTQEMRQERVRECREIRQQVALRYSELSDAEKKAAKENPTATYEHCLMRVKTMTDKALLNRVKAIERATGKHCVVKMAIFKSCLQDEEMWELAEAAAAALERLKALLPPPE